MLSIRVMVYAVLLLTLLIFACLFLFHRERQAYEEQAHISRIEARLPKVKEALIRKKQVYVKREGSAAEDEIEECAICLDHFSEENKDEVVILDCGAASK